MICMQSQKITGRMIFFITMRPVINGTHDFSMHPVKLKKKNNYLFSNFLGPFYKTNDAQVYFVGR